MTNNIQPVLSGITIYPIKSLDGMNLQSSKISDGGCLLHDREFALIDVNGNFINGKSNPLVHSLRSFVDFEKGIMSFKSAASSGWLQFQMSHEKAAIESFLTEYFHEKTHLIQNNSGRFMDIPDISGATLLSTSTLQEISTWFDIKPEEARKRFRATLEITGVTAFWEDHLFSHEGRAIEFRVGDVTLFGMSPRARCVVPTRHPDNGVVTHAFAKSFSKHRAMSLPVWSTLEEYGHHYYLTVNCHIPASETGKTIETGNSVTIIGEKVLVDL